jgi:NAD-dependent oxidoreductase involved in siderophore biosynthesis
MGEQGSQLFPALLTAQKAVEGLDGHKVIRDEVEKALIDANRQGRISEMLFGILCGAQ